MMQFMKRIGSNTMWQGIELKELLLLWILSIVVILLLSSCDHAPKFPTKTLWEVDYKNKVCGEYEVVDEDRLTFRPVKDWPIDKCDGVFGFSTADTPKVLNWVQDVKAYIKDHCKK